MARCQFAAEYGDDPAVLALHRHPFFISLDRDGCESDLDTQLVCFEEQFFHDVARYVARGLEEYAQRQRVMDVGLTDVKNLGVEARQYLCQRRCDAGAVIARDIDEY